jgi:hypothetical protein
MGQTDQMGMVVTLVDSAGREAFNFADPAGGSFDAAGDFDRLIGQNGDWLVWGAVEEHGVTTLDSEKAKHLLKDLSRLVDQASDGPERRGLDRLAVMTADCAADPGASLVFHGD